MVPPQWGGGRLFGASFFTKTGVLGNEKSHNISEFLGPKKCTLLGQNHVLATTRQSCAKEKVPFSQINISLLADFGCYFGKNGFSARFPLFGKA